MPVDLLLRDFHHKSFAVYDIVQTAFYHNGVELHVGILKYIADIRSIAAFCSDESQYFSVCRVVYVIKKGDDVLVDHRFTVFHYISVMKAANSFILGKIFLQLASAAYYLEMQTGPYYHSPIAVFPTTFMLVIAARGKPQRLSELPDKQPMKMTNSLGART